MHTKGLVLLVSFTLGVGALQAAEAPLDLQAGPPFAEVKATWTAFWTAVRSGNFKEARQHLHSHQRAGFPGNLDVKELQDLANQMAYCHLDPTPFPLSLLGDKSARQVPPGALADLQELFYAVHCKYGDETAESLVGVRRDGDGVWRLVLLR